MNTDAARGDFRLDGRVALVTGAAGLLGRAAALELARSGATVLLAGRDLRRLEPLSQDIAALGGRAAALPLESGPAGFRVLDGLHEAGGRLDILVNTMAPAPHGNPEDTRGDGFAAAVSSLIAHPFELTCAAAPLLERGAATNGPAAVIHVGAPFGRATGEASSHSRIVRAGVPELIRVLARRLAPMAIRVNAVMPGPVLAPAIEAARPVLADEIRRTVPMGRLGMPEDVAAAVHFLASAAAAWVTGAILPVDGGGAARF